MIPFLKTKMFYRLFWLYDVLIPPSPPPPKNVLNNFVMTGQWYVVWVHLFLGDESVRQSASGIAAIKL